jgi:hypothetical protein
MSTPFNTPWLADPVIDAYKRDVDRSLLRENLRLTWEERLIKGRRLQELAAELARAGRALRRRP